MKKTLLIFTLFSLGFTFSQNIFQDDFAGYTVNQELNGQGLWTNNSVSPFVGIGSCLNPSMGTCSNAKVLAQTISYLNFGTSIKSIMIAPVQDGVARRINPTVSGGDLYVALVLNIATAPISSGNPSDFFRVNNGANPNGFPSDVAFRMLVQDATFGYKIGIRKGSSSNLTVYTNDLYNFNENVLVVFKYSHLSGTNDDILKVFVNPDFAAGEPQIPSATTTNGLDQSGFIDRFILRQNYNVLAAMPTGFAGLASTSTTWDGLGFLPLGSDSFNASNEILFSYNPQNGLTVNSNKKIDNAVVNIYSISGSLIENKKITITTGSSEIAIDSKLSTGMYIIKLTDVSGKNYTQKLIIQK